MSNETTNTPAPEESSAAETETPRTDEQNSTDITIADFCDIHDACDEGRKWALSTGMTTMSELWNHPELPHEWRICIFCKKGTASEHNQRLFAVWCARQVQHLLTDPRSIAAIDVAERFANGLATRKELEAAYFSAWHAVEHAAKHAAYSVAYSVAEHAAYSDAWHAAEHAAYSAAGHAAAAHLTTNFPTWESLTK